MNTEFIQEKKGVRNITKLNYRHQKSYSLWFYCLPWGFEGRELCKEREVNEKPLWKSSEADSQQKKKKIKLFQVNVPGLAKRKRMFKQRSTGLTKVKFREEFFGLRTSKWSFESRTGRTPPPLENYGVGCIKKWGWEPCGSHQTMAPSQMLFTFNTLLIYISLKTYQRIWVLQAKATWRGWKKANSG